MYSRRWRFSLISKTRSVDPFMTRWYVFFGIRYCFPTSIKVGTLLSICKSQSVPSMTFTTRSLWSLCQASSSGLESLLNSLISLSPDLFCLNGKFTYHHPGMLLPNIFVARHAQYPGAILSFFLAHACLSP